MKPSFSAGAFGSPMSNRSFNANSSRYGFNGKEIDNEMVGTGQGTQDYGMRIYNPALGKFLSIDPLTRSYPMLTPYQFASNSPLAGVDLDGLEYVTYTIFIQSGKVTEIQKATDYKLQNENTKGAGKQYVYVSLDQDGKEISRSENFAKNKSNDYGIFGGKNNPLIPKIGSDPADKSSYVEDFELEPIDEYDSKYKTHDEGFAKGDVVDKEGTFKNPKAFGPNKQLVKDLEEIKAKRQKGEKDNVTGEKYSLKGRLFAAKAHWLFSYIVKKNEKVAKTQKSEKKD